MVQPIVDDFTNILLQRPLDEIVKTLIFKGAPYAFRSKPDAMGILQAHLQKNLGVKSESVAIVGSGKMGFSLSPDTFAMPFSDESDIDVIIVNNELFDSCWSTILKWHYPRRYTGLEISADRGWAGDRKKDIYWGWIEPDRIKFTGLTFPQTLRPLRDFSTRWFNTFKGLSRYTDFAGRNVNGRLYRTWEHATLYHVEGLRVIKAKVSEGKGV